MPAKFQRGGGLGRGAGEGAPGEAQRPVPGERQQQGTGWAHAEPFVSLTEPSPPSHFRLRHETKLCEQMVLMVPGLGRNLPRQAGQRGQSLTCQVCREPQGSGVRGGGGERLGQGYQGGAWPRGKVLRAGEPGLVGL